MTCPRHAAIRGGAGQRVRFYRGAADLQAERRFSRPHDLVCSSGFCSCFAAGCWRGAVCLHAVSCSAPPRPDGPVLQAARSGLSSSFFPSAPLISRWIQPSVALICP